MIWACVTRIMFSFTWKNQSIKLLYLSDATWRQISGSALVEAIPFCLTTTLNYHLNQRWLMTSKVSGIHPRETSEDLKMLISEIKLNIRFFKLHPHPSESAESNRVHKHGEYHIKPGLVSHPRSTTPSPVCIQWSHQSQTRCQIPRDVAGYCEWRHEITVR